MSNPYTEILNQIVKALLPKLNGAIGGAIRSKGLDPLAHVASGSKSFGIGEASYSVTNLTGLSSVNISELEVGDVSGSGTNLSGKIAIHAVLGSDLAANISGHVKVLFADPGISGKVSVSGASLSGVGTFGAGVDGGKICLNSVNLTSADFNYAHASATIDGAGILNDILKPLENLILDAVKGDIRSLISSQVKGILNSEVGKVLPECAAV